MINTKESENFSSKIKLNNKRMKNDQYEREKKFLVQNKIE